MKILTSYIRLSSYILSFSLFSISSVKAFPLNDLITVSPTQHFIAQTTTSTVTTRKVTIQPPLTPQQKASWKAIDSKYQPLIQAAIEKYKKSLKDLEALFGTNPTDEVIRNRYNQAKEARGELTDLLIESALELRSVLTPEQKASMADDIRRFLEKP